MAWGGIVAGRLLVGVTIASILICRVTRATWAGLPRDDSGMVLHPIPQTMMAIALVVGFVWCFLLLPVGPVELVCEREGQIRVATVLGRRTVRRPFSAVSWLWLPSRVDGSGAVVLRSGWRWVVVTASGNKANAAARLEAVAGIDRAESDGSSRAFRGSLFGAGPLFRGIAFIVVQLLTVLLVAGLLAAIAGIVG